MHAWAIYAVIGLALAYFGYRKGQPLIIRSAFHPILGDRIHGPIGDLIDIFAVVGTLAGLATSLGLGVAQLDASMNYLFGLPQDLSTQLILICVVTILATLTVATGLDNGIRRLSEFILIVSFALALKAPTRFQGLAGLALLTVVPAIVGLLLVGGGFGLSYVPTNAWGGLMLNVLLTLVAGVGGFVLGIILAFGRRSRLPVVRWLSVFFIELWRGVPLLTVLFMAMLLVPLFMPRGVTVDNLVRAMLALTLFTAWRGPVALRLLNLTALLSALAVPWFGVGHTELRYFLLPRIVLWVTAVYWAALLARRLRRGGLSSSA